MAPPDVKPTDNGVDVDITFRVEEKRTGNINFGASLGQGTGLGGFLGLEEPNLFGRGKRGRLMWQFGRNINDFTLSYTDPAIRESRTSGTLTLFNSRQRFTVGDLGRRRQIGGSLQLGFPFFGSRYTRIFTSYGLQQIKLHRRLRRPAAPVPLRQLHPLHARRQHRPRYPVRPAVRHRRRAHQRHRRVQRRLPRRHGQLPQARFRGPLLRAPRVGRRQRPSWGSGVQFVLGLTAKSGFIFGDAGPFFTELYSLGGTQFGIPLRGYDEFSITPNGFDPSAGGSTAASVNAFGKSYAAFTVEAGARVSQSLYFSTFFDAGNVYRSARQYDPSRLFRGAGFGVAVLSPLGPIGIDLGYGFDKVNNRGSPDPAGSCTSSSAISSRPGDSHFSREYVDGPSFVRPVPDAGAGAGRSSRRRLVGPAERAEDRLHQRPGGAAGDPGIRPGGVDLQPRARGFRAEVEKLQASLDSAAADFEQKSVMLSATAQDRQAEGPRGQQRTGWSSGANELQEKAAQREQELLAPIQDKVNEAIESVRPKATTRIIFDVSANDGLHRRGGQVAGPDPEGHRQAQGRP